MACFLSIHKTWIYLKSQSPICLDKMGHCFQIHCQCSRAHIPFQDPGCVGAQLASGAHGGEAGLPGREGVCTEKEGKECVSPASHLIPLLSLFFMEPEIVIPKLLNIALIGKY
ncbi:UNVERIFIED_CONTAM: hypothetical protein K2H54_043773 [Gekko kuhli]